MKEYIVVQMLVESITETEGKRVTVMGSLVVRVFAKTKEEAIGIFVEKTHHVQVHQRLDIECLDFDKLPVFN